jgi:hypothetical protein
MSDITAFKSRLRGEVDAAKQRVEAIRAETEERYTHLRERYETFLRLSQRIREALKPRVEAFAEALPGAKLTVSTRDFGPAGRGFHGAVAAFTIDRSDRCPANVHVRFALDAGPDVENLVLSYEVEILPVFLEFERRDQLVLPLDDASLEKAVDWFDRKALAFTDTLVAMFFNPYYQRESEVRDVVLDVTFPRAFAKGQVEHDGKTLHFFTEESLKAFRENPDRYISPATTA